MSATTPTWLDANVPKPKPRPVTTLPFCRLDAATFGFQLAAAVTASMTDSQRAGPTPLFTMFSLRNAIGSIPAAYASSSTICSLAK